jgi:4-amino-4-deoxy-L-arabinose transferase-like glycosyltransferase
VRVAIVLVLITALAGVLRFDAAASPSPRQSVDERAYGRLARALATKSTYGDPHVMSDPVRWPPGAPFVFGLAHQLFPRESERPVDVPAAYPIQAAAGTLLVPAVFALAALAAGPVAGLVAAGAIAVYPPLVTASGDLLTEPLGSLALAVALIAVVLALRRPGPRRGALAGVLLGLAVLVRADLVLLPFVLAAVVALVLRSRRGTLTAAVLAGAAVLTLAPWSVYASSVAGRFVPVSSGGASNLFVGTYLPGDGTMFGLKRALGFRPATPQLFVIDRVAREHGSPPAAREDALRDAAADNVRRYLLGDPLGFAGMALRKVDRLWLSSTVGTYGTERPWTRAYHLLLVGLGALGLIAGLVATRGRAPALWVVVAVVAYLTAVNVVLVSEARHNLPVMPVLVAGGVAGLARAYLSRKALMRSAYWPSSRAYTP